MAKEQSFIFGRFSDSAIQRFSDLRYYSSIFWSGFVHIRDSYDLLQLQRDLENHFVLSSRVTAESRSGVIRRF